MKYPCKIQNERIGNLNLRIVGVRHRSYFFKKYESFFRDEISKASHVFLEDVLDEEFYQKLADIVWEKGQPVYVPDAPSVGCLLSDTVVAGTGGYLFGVSMKRIISRRNFIKNGLMAVGGLYLATAFSGEGLFQPVVGPEVTLDDKLAYNATLDFRNIICAENFERVERDLGIRGDATFFIGKDHVNGLSAYIRNPELRRKRILYLPQELFTDSKIKEYRKVDGYWKVVRKV